jgi:hypothetical protein
MGTERRPHPRRRASLPWSLALRSTRPMKSFLLRVGSRVPMSSLLHCDGFHLKKGFTCYEREESDGPESIVRLPLFRTKQRKFSSFGLIHRFSSSGSCITTVCVSDRDQRIETRWRVIRCPEPIRRFLPRAPPSLIESVDPLLEIHMQFTDT